MILLKVAMPVLKATNPPVYVLVAKHIGGVRWLVFVSVEVTMHSK